MFKQYGLGLPGCSFFGMDGGQDVVVATPTIRNAAIISVQSNNVSLQMISDELCEWGLEGWDWQLQQISETEFGVVFPSQESLRMLSKSTSFTFCLLTSS